MSTELSPVQTALDQAFKACDGISRLAAAIDVAPSTPSMWKARGSVPAEVCAAIERATGGRVTRRQLRPTDWHRIWPELVTEEFPAPEEARDAA